MKIKDKIEIEETKKCNLSSWREGGEIPPKETLADETKAHIKAVATCMAVFAKMIENAGKMHDHTKLEYIDEFYGNLVEVAKDDKIEFKELGWWKKHLTERHHLDDRCPDDVNLIDVLEYVCDCVCAGKARNGEVRPVELPYELLDKAFRNTAEMLEKVIKVVPPEKKGE